MADGEEITAEAGDTVADATDGVTETEGETKEETKTDGSTRDTEKTKKFSMKRCMESRWKCDDMPPWKVFINT